jgi:transketolase
MSIYQTQGSLAFVRTTGSSIEDSCVNAIRGLAMDAVEKANSGHPGLPMGAAAMAFALWTRHLRHNPKNPDWFNRDRFILSAGHGCMLQYALLHLTGYDVSLEDLKNFRQWESKTPGHPENFMTPGVEMATGPLGQGLATSVGMAIAEAHLAARFNKPNHKVIDHYTYVICSDGDLMEGVAQEACSLAGHLGLGKLIALYDSNSITIDGDTDQAFTEDTAKKYEAMGWHVVHADGMNVDEVDNAIKQAKLAEDKPSLVICRTTIGFGAPSKAGTKGVHGAPLGTEELAAAKEQLGLSEEPFSVPHEVRAEFDKAIEEGARQETEWKTRFNDYKAEFASEAEQLENALAGNYGDAWVSKLPSFTDAKATRANGGDVLNAIAGDYPFLIGGSADLFGSNNNYIKEGGDFSKENPEGRNIFFGVREHGMAAIVNGITLHGASRGEGATFLIFSDYCRPSLRLAALMKCPSLFIFTHDSIGLGEDGPTHQPIEHLMALRAIPNFNLMRPADGNETAACFKLALQATDHPSALALTRQKLPVVTPGEVKNHPAERGAYVLRKATGNHQLCLIASGSEVKLCLDAAEEMEKQGIGTSVVSFPSWFVFERQDAEYKKQVLPVHVKKLAVEAGATLGWYKYADEAIGLDRFGSSAPGPVVMDKLGFNVANVVAAAKQLVG